MFILTSRRVLVIVGADKEDNTIQDQLRIQPNAFQYPYLTTVSKWAPSPPVKPADKQGYLYLSPNL